MRLGHPDGRPGNMHQAQRKSKYRNTLTLEEKIVCVHDESWAQVFLAPSGSLVLPRQKSQVS